MIRTIGAVALIILLVMCFAEGSIVLVNKENTELVRCVLTIIRQFPRRIYKISVSASVENSTLVTHFVREINAPVVINAVESPKPKFDTQVRSDLVLIFKDNINVALLLKQVLWYGDTKFIMACGSGCKVLDAFQQFWRKRVVNVFAVVDDGEGIRLCGYRPYQSNNCSSTAPIVLDYWTNGTFSNGGFRSINGGLKDVSQCPIKVSVTKIKPAVIFLDHSNSTFKAIDGTEVRLLQVVGEKLNFTPMFALPDDGLTWGTIFPPRGVMGTLYNASSEFAIGFISVTLDRLNYLELSRPYSGKECLTFAVPRGAGTTKLTWLINITGNFWPIEWVLIFVSLINVMILIYIAKQETLPAAFTYTFASFLGVPVKIPEETHVKWLSICWVFYSLVISNIYQASLGSKMTVPFRPSEIETIRELLQSDLEITGHPNFKIAMTRQLNYMPDMLEVGHRMKAVTYNVDKAIDKIAAHRNTSYLRQLSVLRYSILSSRKARENVRILKECVINLHTAVAMHKGSPFKNSVDDIMIRLSESGIYRYWRSQFIYKIKHPPRKFKPLTLTRSLGVFVLLVVGLSVAFMVFLMELGMNYLKPTSKRTK